MPDPDTSKNTSPQSRKSAAETLLLNEEFEAAQRAYEALLPEFPKDRQVVFPTAILRHHFGDDAAGEALMQDYFRRVPVQHRQKASSETRPRILKFRGQNKTRVLLAEDDDGTRWLTFRGGHFTTRYLLDGADVGQNEYTIAGADDIPAEALPDHDLLVNVISDPDRETPALQALQRFLGQGGHAPVINQPDRVFRTTRDSNYKRFQHLKTLGFPKTDRLAFTKAGPDEVANRLSAAGFETPVILRRTGTQSGETTALISNRQDLETYVAQGLTGEFYAIRYHAIYWRQDFFRKLRLFSIDGTFYPVVCHLDRDWNVHGGNRRTIMRTDDNLMDEEKRFLADWKSYVGAKAVDALEAAAEDTGLDFFGIDFTVDDAGLPFIYELNASMRHSFDHAKAFPYKLPYDRAVTEAFTAMVENRIASASQAKRDLNEKTRPKGRVFAIGKPGVKRRAATPSKPPPEQRRK